MGSRDRLGALFIVAEGLLVNVPRQGFPKEGGAGFELTSVLVEIQMTFLNGGNCIRVWKEAGLHKDHI